jgi:hypothetical protein
MNDNYYLEKTLMSGWQFLMGDVNYTDFGGKWVKQIENNIYHIIELINMWDCTGDYNQDKYNVSLQEINLDLIDIQSALKYCGWGNDVDITDPLIIVESISSYGSYAPMGDYNGNNYRKLLREAKNESNKLASDEFYHGLQLDRPVNRLGSTACEYMQGDFQSAMLRGISQDDSSAKIFGKIHGLSNDDMEGIKGQLDDFSLTSNNCK